ncbi:MAG: carboxypeptidase regulatory-like domain-containing protein [bacterium]|nr:carboxypeptidase regulatory-like domain-containing protein [bacterium]
MVRKTFLTLIILAAGIFSLHLLPAEPGIIGGTVLDKTTGKAVADASVYLLKDHMIYFMGNKALPQPFKSYKWKRLTDAKGKFSFDLLLPGQYYLGVFKKGYAYYGLYTIGCVDKEKKTHSKSYFNMAGWINDLPEAVKGRIHLKAGKKKNLTLKLEKEAAVEISFIMKTENDERPLQPRYGTEADKFGKVAGGLVVLDAAALGYRQEVYCFPTQGEPGRIVIGNLPAGVKARISYSVVTYPGKTKEVVLKKGEILKLRHVLDFTTGMVVHGYISARSEGATVEIKQVEMAHRPRRVRAIIDEVNGFWVKGRQAGPTRLIVQGVITKDGTKRKFKRAVSVTLEEGKRVELDLSY